MKAFWVIAAAGLGLMGTVGSGSAQPYGGYDRGYREQRDSGPPPGYRDRGGGFDEGEYLRCNPDVRRAVRRGQVESGFDHYRTFGRRERRNLSC